ncbi:MAG: hypothetical protein EXS03_05180 [Phycisphaerales bacterium]|nr:hypothetical protein [Phycisphaerales bacterium]
MFNLFTLSMVAFLAGVLAARHFGLRALRCLGEQDRAALVEIAARSSLFNLVVPLAVGLVYLVVVMNFRELTVTATVAALALLLVQAIIGSVKAGRAYKAHGMPDAFMWNFRVARSCRLVGFACLVVGVVAWLATNMTRHSDS